MRLKGSVISVRSARKLIDTFTRLEKYPIKLDISRSFIRIFEQNLEDTFTRLEKYPSKLDISRSFIRIFVGSKLFGLEKNESPYYQGARAGVPIGLYFVAMFFLFVLMTKLAFASAVLMLMMVCLPIAVYATMRTTVGRTRGKVVWSSLWMQGIMSFLFGSVICGLVTMVYLKFVEPNFLVDLFQMCIDTYASIPGKEAEQATEMLQNIVKHGGVPTATSFTMSMFWLTAFSGSMLSLFLALIASAVGKHKYRQIKNS